MHGQHYAYSATQKKLCQKNFFFNGGWVKLKKKKFFPDIIQKATIQVI